MKLFFEKKIVQLKIEHPQAAGDRPPRNVNQLYCADQQL